MRPLLPLLLIVGSLSAEDDLPLLTCTWDGHAPGGEAAGPWNDAYRAGTAWLAAQGVPSAHPSGPAQVTGWIQFRGDDLPPHAWISGWATAHGPDVDLHWPGLAITRAGERLVFHHEGAPTVPSASTTAGLAITAWGATLAKTIAANAPPAQRTILRQLFAPLEDLTLCARITPAESRLTLTSTTPLTAIDPAALAHHPRTALVTVALGLGPATTAWSPGTLVWSVLPDRKGMVMSISDGPQTRQRLAACIPGLSIDTGETAPDDEASPGITIPGSAMLVRRWQGRWWLLSQGIELSPTPTPWPALPDHTQGVLISARGCAPLAAALRWPGVSPVAMTAEEVVVTVDATGTVATTTHDLPLAWWGMAAGLSWLAGVVEDRAGCHLLAEALERLRRQGHLMSVEEFRRRLPSLPAGAPTAKAMSQWQVELPPVPPRDDHARSINDLAREEGLPLASLTTEDRDALHTLLGTLEPLLSLDPAQLSALPWLTSPATTHPAEVLLPHVNHLRTAAQAGVRLVMAGDATGMLAVDRACRAARQPRTLIELLVLNSLESLRDSALLAMLVQGMPLPPESLDAPPEYDRARATALAGEELLLLSCAQQFVDDAIPLHLRTSWGTESSPILTCDALAHPDHHARLAAGTAALLPQVVAALAGDDQALTQLTSPNAGTAEALISFQQLLPAYHMIDDTQARLLMQYHLLRLMRDCLHAAEGQDPPHDTTAMEQRLGHPLRIPVGHEQRACTWRYVPGGLRQLAVDLSGPQPAGLNDEAWLRLRRQTAPAPEDAFVMRCHLIQVHPRRPAQPIPATSAF